LRRALPALGRLLPALESAPRGWHRAIATLAQRLPRGRRSNFYLRGLTLGSPPCGLRCAALAAAAASLYPLPGAWRMVAFGESAKGGKRTFGTSAVRAAS